ncbi:hypothetical protein Gogos_000873, partial [Gossypium gossypioides]|nr:hypothetical protein [Gossypium gossypioides]
LEIENLAPFAVDKHKKKWKVSNVKQQVVFGTMYYITLEAMDGDKTKVYEAKVWDMPWMNFKEL